MAKRTFDGVPLHADEHYTLMDDVMGDVEKVKAIINKMYEDALRLVLKIDDNDKRDAIILAGQQVEGLELLKQIWKV